MVGHRHLQEAPEAPTHFVLWVLSFARRTLCRFAVRSLLGRSVSRANEWARACAAKGAVESLRCSSRTLARCHGHCQSCRITRFENQVCRWHKHDLKPFVVDGRQRVNDDARGRALSIVPIDLKEALLQACTWNQGRGQDCGQSTCDGALFPMGKRGWHGRGPTDAFSAFVGCGWEVDFRPVQASFFCYLHTHLLATVPAFCPPFPKWRGRKCRSKNLCTVCS